MGRDGPSIQVVSSTAPPTAPGRLELAHQPGEYCEIADMLAATRVLSLAMLDLCGVAGG
jgi:acetylornithine deacetylase/succinyl-diaminopimelate desuccinylase-like protein